MCPVPGGGDTSALTMDGGCTVYGLSNGQNGSKTGWFTLSRLPRAIRPGLTWAPRPPRRPPEQPRQPQPPPRPPLRAIRLWPLPRINARADRPAGSAIVPSRLNGDSTGGFHVAGGQIIGPDGKPWIARGVDVHVDNLGAAAQQLPTQFPGVNLVRVAAGDYEPLEDPSSFAGSSHLVDRQGTVVEFTDYSNSLGTGSGGGRAWSSLSALLANELAWFSAMASYYKNNPYVWLGTNNEPATTGGSLSDWQLATYQAIRNAGNNNMIFLEPSGSRPPGYGGTPLQAAMNPADYTGMNNVSGIRMFTATRTNYSSDPGTISRRDCGHGRGVADHSERRWRGAGGHRRVWPGRLRWDANRHGVINAGASGTTGSAAWVWDTQGTVGGPSGDPTGTIHGGSLSGGAVTTYGQMVQLLRQYKCRPPDRTVS